MNLRHVFFSAPHRMMFFAGALQTLLTMGLWSFELGGRYAGVLPAMSWPLPPMWLHAALMIYGVFSFFVFGFLMTALPKWVAAGPLDQSDYVPAFALLAAGWLLFYLGFLVPALLPWGLFVVAAGWALGAWPLWRTASQSISDYKGHAWVVLIALSCGAAGVALYGGGLLTLSPAIVRAATEIGLWCYLVPVFFTVTHRMLPFFTGNVVRGYVEYRSMRPFRIMLACFALVAIGNIADLRQFFWPAALVGGLTSLWLTWRWQIHKVFVSHLVAMHHTAGLWLAVALLMFAAQGAGYVLGVGWGGRAPLHALTVGYFGSILIGMATRVTLGHSGRLISSDTWAWRLFWLYQIVVLARIGGEWAGGQGFANLIWLSSLGWLAVFGIWVRVHLPMFLRPRPDGRPG